MRARSLGVLILLAGLMVPAAGVAARVQDGSSVAPSTLTAADVDPPTVQVGAPDLQRTGQISGGGTTAAQLGWSAQDPGSGVASYRLARSINGGPLVVILETTAAQETEDVLLMSGRRYQFYVEATDAVGNVSDWVPGAPFTVKTAQETSAAIDYSGPWSRAHPIGAYGRATMRTFRPGASATYRFIGRSVALIAPLGPTRGAMKLYLDGKYEETIIVHDFLTTPRMKLFAMSWPAVGTHTIRLVVISKQHPRVDIDAFVVLR
jgi:hypothetical protein